MDVWLGVAGAILGAFTGWALSEFTTMIANRRRAVKRLQVAAFVCLDRLLKIQDAHERGDEHQRDKEIYHLGGDLDKYRDVIAVSPRLRKEHYKLYRATTPLLLQHDVSELATLIEWYESNAKVSLEASDPGS
jgi:hypothetical protein